MSDSVKEMLRIQATREFQAAGRIRTQNRKRNKIARKSRALNKARGKK